MARWHRSHESVFVSGATDDRSLRGPAQRYRLELVHQCRRVHAAIHYEPGFIRGLGHKFSPAGHHLWPEHRDQSGLRSAAVLPAGPLMKGADEAIWKLEFKNCSLARPWWARPPWSRRNLLTLTMATALARLRDTPAPGAQ